MRRLTGRWPIVEMDLWNRDAVELVEPGFLEFTGDGTGRFGFVAVHGAMDCQTTERDGRTLVEFGWDGDDDGNPASGRGRATLAEDATLAASTPATET